jgi:hypothetical protein
MQLVRQCQSVSYACPQLKEGLKPFVVQTYFSVITLGWWFLACSFYFNIRLGFLTLCFWSIPEGLFL